MDIRSELIREHSKTNALKIADYAVQSPANFKQLMKCYTDTDRKVAQRAAWSVCWAADKKPELAIPYVETLVAQIARTDVHPAVVRGGLWVLQSLDVPEALHGVLMDTCFRLVEKQSSPVAIKALALENLLNLSKFYPEIKDEMKLIIEEKWDNETAAFRAKGRRILKKK